MRNGLACPNSGGSTICGNSGARVCVRSTTRIRPLERPADNPASVLVPMCLEPRCRELVDDAADGGAAADEQGLAGDEARVWRREEEHRARDVLRPSEPPYGDRLDDPRQLRAVLWNQVLEDLGLADRPGRHDVDGDPLQIGRASC